MKKINYIFAFRTPLMLAVLVTICILMVFSIQKEVRPQEFIPSADGKLRNPTFAEAVWFMQNDTVSDRIYTDSYTCLNFSVDTANNAIEAGIMCFPTVIIKGDTAHAVVAFHTTDFGMQYFEPQNDKIIDPMESDYDILSKSQLEWLTAITLGIAAISFCWDYYFVKK